MGWFLLESMVALLVAVGIVWWTMRPAGRRDAEATKDESAREAQPREDDR